MSRRMTGKIHERLPGEKETLGFYLEGHPITRYEKRIVIFISTRLSKVKPRMNLTVAGYIESIRTRTGIRGRMAEVMLDDKTARIQMTVYSENYQRHRNLLLKDQLIIVKGEAVADDYMNQVFPSLPGKFTHLRNYANGLAFYNYTYIKVCWIMALSPA